MFGKKKREKTNNKQTNKQTNKQRTEIMLKLNQSYFENPRIYYW